MTSSKARYIATAVLLAAVAITLCASCGVRAEKEQPPAATPTTVIATPQPSATPAPATVTPEPAPELAPLYTQAEAEMLAKVIWAEARGIPSDAEKAAVVWCVLNRVDSIRWPDTIAEIVTQPHQFAYYTTSPVTDELLALAEDVLTRWEQEKNGQEDVGRVLPADYYFFGGDGKRNHFRTEYQASARWDWSLPDPYEN